MNSIKYLLCVLVLFSASSGFSQDSNITKIFLIRHAQTENEVAGERVLSEEGLATAKKWATIFNSEPIELIYSTDYLRTLATAKPIAESKGNLDVITYDPESFDLEKLLTENKGKTILIVGHSGTTPANVNILLGEERYLPIEANTHGNLYIVNYISPSQVSASLLKLE